MASRYRDTRTGRFASRQTWQRSRSHGAKRYKREPVKSKRWREFLVTKFKKQLTIAKGPEVSASADGLPVVEVREVRHLAGQKDPRVLTGVDFVVQAPANSSKSELNSYIYDAIEEDYPDYDFVYELDDIDVYWEVA